MSNRNELCKSRALAASIKSAPARQSPIPIPNPPIQKFRQFLRVFLPAGLWFLEFALEGPEEFAAVSSSDDWNSLSMTSIVSLGAQPHSLELDCLITILPCMPSLDKTHAKLSQVLNLPRTWKRERHSRILLECHSSGKNMQRLLYIDKTRNTWNGTHFASCQ